MSDPALLEAVETMDRGRNVGVLVPPANPVVEPELNRLLPSSLRLFAARLPVLPGATLEARNRGYVDSYAGTLGSFGSLALEAIVVGLTGPSYRLLPPGDRAVADRLSRPGTPVQTASGAIAEALQALGARRICLFSPYPQWLTDEAAGYWTAAGHEIVKVVTVSDKLHAYALTTAQVTDALREVPADGVDATVMSGTGMLTLPAILASRKARSQPLLSSNLCCAWWLMRTLSVSEPSPIFAAAAPELAGLR